MYAAVLNGVGRAPRYEEMTAPVAGNGQAVVRVTAAALKHSDRLMAAGAHYAPTGFPQVAGLDGVGRLDDGSRVAFAMPVRPYGGMAEQTLVRENSWFPVPDDVDDVTAAAVLNPGGAAWKTIVWEGELTAGQTVLVLGATGAAGRIAAQIAVRHHARVVVAGRNQRALDELVARGADTAIRVDQDSADLTAALVAAGPYHLIADFLWGPPAEALFAALPRTGGDRYILVGMAAGETATLPALTLRRAPVHLMGSGSGRPATPADFTAAYHDLLRQVRDGDITLDVETAPLAEVAKVWGTATGERRLVLVP
jgi:NADPH2:quinone reductase